MAEKQIKKSIPLTEVSEQLGLEGLFTKEQEQIISSLKGRMDVALLLRNFFLQAELTENEKVALKEFATPQWLPILKRIFFPELDFTRPLGQLRDMWSFMVLDNRDAGEASVELAARATVIEYLKDRFAALTDGAEIGRVKLIDMTPTEGRGAYESLVGLNARRIILAGAESGTLQLLVVANKKEETEAEQAERLKADSSK